MKCFIINVLYWVGITLFAVSLPYNTVYGEQCPTNRPVEPPHKSFTQTETLGVFDSKGKGESGVIIHRDGKIEMVGETKLPQAAEAFWRTVQEAYPDFCTPCGATQAPPKTRAKSRR
jgi:hypothetical protein